MARGSSSGGRRSARPPHTRERGAGEGRGGAALRGRGRPDSSRTRAPRPRPNLPSGAPRPRGPGVRKDLQKAGAFGGTWSRRPLRCRVVFFFLNYLLAATLSALRDKPLASERSRPLLLRGLCRGLRLLPCAERCFEFKDHAFRCSAIRASSSGSFPLPPGKPWRPGGPSQPWPVGVGPGAVLSAYYTQKDSEAESDLAEWLGKRVQGRTTGDF